MIRHTALVAVVVLVCAGGVLAQDLRTQIAQQAQGLSQQSGIPVNVALRFKILSDQVGRLTGDGDPLPYLKFFSQTRNLFWSRPVPPNLETPMRNLESLMVQQAASRGHSLDLPPVGYSPASAGRMLGGERSTAEGLGELVLRAEEMATEMLGQLSSAELLFLRDSLTRLREDLQSPSSISVDSVRSVMGARARFLAAGGQAQVARDPRMMERLNNLVEALRATFPPQRLRQASGGRLTW